MQFRVSSKETIQEREAGDLTYREEELGKCLQGKAAKHEATDKGKTGRAALEHSARKLLCFHSQAPQMKKGLKQDKGPGMFLEHEEPSDCPQ